MRNLEFFFIVTINGDFFGTIPNLGFLPRKGDFVSFTVNFPTRLAVKEIRQVVFGKEDIKLFVDPIEK